MQKIHFYCGKVNSQGGSKISLLNILFLLKKEKKIFDVFVSEEGWFTKQLRRRNIDYSIINEPYFIKKIKGKTNILLKLFYLFLSLPVLFKNWIIINKRISDRDKVVFNENRDLILFYPILYRNKVKKILWIRSEYISTFTKIFMRNVDKLIAVTDVVKNNINHLIPNKSIYRVHNFMFDKPYNIKNKSLEDSVINLAVIGSIQKIKGQLDAVKVLGELNNGRFMLYIVGRETDEHYTNKIKQLITKENLENNVQILGHVDNIPDFINENIHLTIIPSQTESFCRVAMESFSVGVPVIAYRVGGLNEVVTDKKTGILVEKDDIIGISQSIQKLLSNKISYNYMRVNAVKDWENRFYFESIKQELFEALD